MKIDRMLALKVFLAVVVVYHGFLGIAANVLQPGPVADAILAMSYGVSFEISPITQHIMRLLGAFMLFVAVAAFVAFRDPVRYQGIIYCLITLFAVRIFQRLAFSSDLTQYFSIAPDRIGMQIVFFILLIGLLLYLRPKSTADSAKG